MNRLAMLCAILVLAVADAALAQDVRYNFDKTANFAAFRTYKWVTIKGASQLSDLADRQVKAAVDAELAKKGLTRTDDAAADLYIGYQPGVSKEKEYTSFDTGWGYGPGWYGGGWGWDYPYVYQEGVIGVDIYDGKSKQALWHASVDQNLVGATGEKAEKKIQDAVAAIFTKYPR